MPTLPGVPEQIARYKLLSELGRGSMGQVYLALDPNIERKVALKIFLPLLKVGAAEQWELRQRFVLEARAAGQLNHPGIVTIFDADTDPDTGLSYLAMEWVNGPSLDVLIRESAPLAVERTIAIVEQVATALDAAHRQGLVHRDIKPANILLESDGRAKVTDFGIAKLASMSITATGWIPGSPFYMSPEQIRNEGIDRRSDLYSLGAVLYQCLTGSLPFEAESLAALTHMILEIDPRPARAINPAITADLAAVIDRALAKSPADRFGTGHELAQALRLARAGRLREAPGFPPASGRARHDALTADELAGQSGGGTVGLVAAREGERRRGAAAGLPSPAKRASAEAGPAPAEPKPRADPPAAAAPDRATPKANHVRKLAAVLAAGLAMLAAWSLRPVQSEPTTGPLAPGQRFSTAPRFDVAAPHDGGDLLLPVELTEPAEPAEPSLAAQRAFTRPLPAMPPRTPATMAPPTTSEAVTQGPTAEAAKPAGPEPGIDAVPTEAAPPPPQPPVRATSTLELVYRNRLANASMSIWVDGEKVWTGEMATPRNLFKRAVGKNVFASLAVTPGEHAVDVRITGAEGKLDLVRQAEATFEEGQTQRLRVSVTPFKKLKLSWKEPASG